MAEYWGMLAIAKRLGYKSARPVERLIIKEGLIAQKLVKPGAVGWARRPCWHTTDALIELWIISKSRVDSEELKKRIEARKPDSRKGRVGRTRGSEHGHP